MFKEYLLRKKLTSRIEKEKHSKKSQASPRKWGLAARLEPCKMIKKKKK